MVRNWRFDRFSFPSGASVLQLLEAEEGSGDLEVEGDFEMEKELVGADAVVIGAEGQGGAHGGVFGIGGDGVDVDIEVRFLDAPNSLLPPAGRDDGFHEHGLGWSAGLMLVQEFI
jgi:hypothetical protein